MRRADGDVGTNACEESRARHNNAPADNGRPFFSAPRWPPVAQPASLSARQPPLNRRRRTVRFNSESSNLHAAEPTSTSA